MNWQDRIIRDPQVLAGKPIIRGTRISVELVLEMLGTGWTEADLLRNYPHLTHEDILACLQYASASLSSISKDASLPDRRPHRLPMGIPRVPDAPLHPAMTNAEIHAILDAEDLGEYTRAIAQSSVTD